MAGHDEFGCDYCADEQNRLRIAVCDVGQELPGGGAAQGRRTTAAMTDDDVATDHLVLEAGGWVGHGIQTGWRAGRR